MIAELDVVPELAELGQLVAIADGAAGARPEFDQSSDQLLAHARRCKERKRSQAQLAEAQAQKRHAVQTLHAVAASHPSVRRIFALLAESGARDPSITAEVAMKLACSPRIRGETFRSELASQGRAVHLLSAALLAEQADFFEGMFAEPRLPALTADRELCRRRVVAFAVQWDETSQRTRAARSALPQARPSSAQVSAQICVMSGRAICRRLVEACGQQRVVESIGPFHSLSKRLEKQDTDSILEAILPSLPFAFEDLVAMSLPLTDNEAIVVTICVDRAAVNLLAGKYMFHVIEHVLKAKNMLFNAELCGMHGVALVKNRVMQLKKLTSALVSFTRWLRVSANHVDFERQLVDFVRSGVEVRNERRPDLHREFSAAMLSHVFGGSDSGYLWKWSSAEKRHVKTSLLRDLEGLVSFISFGPDARKPFVFYNYVEPGSDDAECLGKSPGSKIFASTSDCADRVSLAVVAIFCSRSWMVAAESRWTHAGITLRKWFLGLLCGRALVESLKAVKVKFNLDSSMDSQLAALIAMDSNNFSAANKLRLLRIVQSVSDPESDWTIAVGVLAGGPMEDLQYRLMGHLGDSPSLREILEPHKTLIGECQHKLMCLATEFSKDPESPWFLLHLVRAQVVDDRVRRSVRRHIVQSSAGVLDIFELRYEGMPYRLAWLCYVDVSAELKQESALSLFALPEKFLSFMSKGLRDMYPSMELMLSRAPFVLEPWLANAFPHIHRSERMHNEMRQDVSSSTGLGSCFHTSAARRLIRNLVVEHESYGGIDPSSRNARVSVCAPPEGVADQKGRKGIGGSVFMEFHAARARSYKALHSPDVAVSAQLRSEMEQRIKEEWPAVANDPEQYKVWTVVFDARRGVQAIADSSRPLAHVEVVASGAAGSEMFRGLWGRSQNKAHILDPLVLADFQRRARQDKLDFSADREQVETRAPAPARTAGIAGTFNLFGCHAAKRNLCREHLLSRSEAVALDDWAGNFNAWADALAAERRESAEELFLLVGTEGEQDDSPVWASCLLAISRRSPKMHIFAACAAAQASGEWALFFDQREFPFVVRILGRTPRMCASSAGMTAMSLSTSDELCRRLLGRKPTWRLHPAEYTLDGGPPSSLLHMTVFGKKEAFVHNAKVRRKTPGFVRTEVPDILDLDPFAHGASLAAASASVSRGSVASSCGASAALEPDPVSAWDLDPELHEYEFGGVPEAFVEDVAASACMLDADESQNAGAPCILAWGCPPPPNPQQYTAPGGANSAQDMVVVGAMQRHGACGTKRRFQVARARRPFRCKVPLSPRALVVSCIGACAGDAILSMTKHPSRMC